MPVFHRIARVMRALRRAPPLPPTRAFVSTGELEGLADENRALASFLRERGVDVLFKSAWDGHHWHNWRDQLRDGLRVGAAAWRRPDRLTGAPRAPVRRHKGGTGMAAAHRQHRPVARRRHLLADLLREPARRPEARPASSGGDRLRLRLRARDDRAVRSAPAGQVRRRDRPADALVHTSREWIKKAIVLNDLYVFNNPWSIQSKEKHTTYCAMMRLGLPIPETWMVPPKAYEHAATSSRRSALRAALRPRRDRREARLSDVHEAVRRRRLGGRHQDRRRGRAPRGLREERHATSCTCRRR